MKDVNNVYLMTKPIKIYVFKIAQEVKISFRISDYCALTKNMSMQNFQYICDNWKKGVQGLETSAGKFYWYHSDTGPRPECEPADFVAINFGDWSFRISTNEMEDLVEEFHLQCNTKMHWD